MYCCLRYFAVCELQGAVLCREDLKKTGSVRGASAENQNCRAGVFGGAVYNSSDIYEIKNTALYMGCDIEEGNKRYGRR